MKNVKVGTMPGRLVEVAVESTMTVKEVFAVAEIDIMTGYELKANGVTITPDEQIGDRALVVQSKMIKGNAERSVKVGIMPGRLVEIMIDDNESIRKAFEVADVTIPSGYELKANGSTVSADDKIGANALIVASKMIKGNSDRTIKVGIMPGRLVEILVDTNTSVKNAFELADIAIPDGYELRADGNLVEEGNMVGDKSLIVASKKIKGNAHVNIKVGTMPGRLVEISIEDTQTIKDAFEIAEIDIMTGYELKANGVTVTPDTQVGSYALIVQSKMIKGNK